MTPYGCQSQLGLFLFLLKIHLLALLFLSVFRIVEYLVLREMVEQCDTSVVTAFVRGIWFDNVIGCYILIVPLVVLMIAGCLGCYHRYLRRFTLLWMGTLYLLAFAISSANIPYFAYFFQNINSSIFNWFGYTGTTTGMMVGESSYLIYVLLWFMCSSLFVWMLCMIECRNARLSDTRIATKRPNTIHLLGRCFLSIIAIALCLFGIRGRMGYNPIKVSAAYYCTNPLLNQLGIAPTFNLLTSVLDDMRKENNELHLMPYDEAITEARRHLRIDGIVKDSTNIMHRKVVSTPSHKKILPYPNVIIIMMESMSAHWMQTFGQKERLTPTLDSLYHHSLAFTQCYSAGVHTNHGLTATLYSFPAMMKRNLMKGTVTPHRAGIPTVLKEYGYHNMFFMTHESQYDNMNAFFRTNGYDEVFSQEDYPASEVVNSFGVSDHFLFSYALMKLKQAASKQQPFMATILTISNHPPYVIPTSFHPHSQEKEKQVVEYADHCIGQFLSTIRKEPWYDNTLFVLLADHGKIVDQVDSELPQSYNHIPLLLFGKGVTPQIEHSLAMQVDVMPTLLGLLGMSYDYNGFGVNLLDTKRDKVFYSADNQIVARDSSACFIHTPSTGMDSYYKYQNGNQKYLSTPDSTFYQLQRYAYAMIQTAEYCYQHQKR